MESGPDILGIFGLVAAASVVFGALCLVIAFRAISHGSGSPVWKGKATTLDRRISAMDSLFGAYPGLVMVWPARSKSAARSIGKAASADTPRLLGSTAALASMRRHAKGQDTLDAASRMLAGLDGFGIVGAPDGRSLSDLVAALRERGEAFSVSLIMPGGGAMDATGRVAGAQAVLWLDDPSLRGEDETAAIRRLDANRSTALKDPLAFVDILDRAGFPVWRVDEAGMLRWANPAYLRAVGAASLDQVVAAQIRFDADAARQTAQVLQTRQASRENRAVVVEGRRRPMQITVYPVAGGAAGVAQDASESEQLRLALMSHVRAHDETLNALSEGVAIFGPDQRMRFHNLAFSNIFELRESWYADSPSHGEWLDTLREARLLPERTDYREWKRSELALYTDWPDEMPDELWSLPDGRTLRMVRQRDPEGGLLILFGDITDQLTLKSQLGTLINVQRATLDKLSEGIAVFGTDGRLRLSNRAFSKMWNIPEARLAEGPRFMELVESLSALHRDADFWTGLGARVTDPDPDVRRMVEGELTRMDGTVLTWLSRPLPDGATLIAWEDQTDARQAETALRERNAALEEANRIKSEFVGHVSYQLRTPLTTIKGYADLLQAGTMGELSDKQSEYMFAVQSAAEDLAKSIDDILDIAAIDANVLDLDLGDVDVFELLATTVDYVATRAEDTRIQLHMECPRDIGVIRADKARLKQVVYNLMLNALRFTKPGGSVTLGAARNEGGMEIWVKDTGVGIPTDAQPRVFESFASSRGGTGLGLALVEKFIERHGGWVDLDSEEGVGTHVTCYLPTEAATRAAHPELSLGEGVDGVTPGGGKVSEEPKAREEPAATEDMFFADTSLADSMLASIAEPG